MGYIWGVWVVMFLVIKVGGTMLKGWSWWWILAPVVPDLFFILTKLGVQL